MERDGYPLPPGVPSAEIVACDKGQAVARVLVRQVTAEMLSSSVVLLYPSGCRRVEICTSSCGGSLSNFGYLLSSRRQKTCWCRSWWSDQCRRSISECARVFIWISGRVPFHSGTFFRFSVGVFMDNRVKMLHKLPDNKYILNFTRTCITLRVW